MVSVSWVDGIDGHIEGVVQAGASPAILRDPNEVADFVRNNIDMLDDSVLTFLGQGFAVLCFRVHMRRVRDPVHMKDQMERLMDAFHPYLSAPHKDDVFNCGTAHVLDIIRSNPRSDFLTLSEIMVSELSSTDKE